LAGGHVVRISLYFVVTFWISQDKEGVTTAIMKNKLLSFALISMIFVAGCKEVDKLLTFTISDEAVIRIENSPLNLPDVPVEVPTPDVTTNSNQEFENNDTRTALVKDIKLQELNLTITDPPGKTFSFLKSITLFISTDGSDEIELAHQNDIPASAVSVALIPTKAKLDHYIKGPSYKLRTSIVTRESLTETIEVRADIRKVTAAPL
jgi:hypothetical protein